MYEQTSVTAAGLAHLRDLKLGYVAFRLIQVTDAGLAHLRGLTTLTSLDLAATQVSDEGLKHLAGLKALEILYLGKNVTGSGLVHVRGLARPCRIYFGRSDVDLVLRHN